MLTDHHHRLGPVTTIAGTQHAAATTSPMPAASATRPQRRARSARVTAQASAGRNTTTICGRTPIASPATAAASGKNSGRSTAAISDSTVATPIAVPVTSELPTFAMKAKLGVAASTSVAAPATSGVAPEVSRELPDRRDRQQRGEDPDELQGP